MKDRIIVMKIIDYTKRVARIYDLIKDMSTSDLLELDESFALTQ